MAKFSDSLSSQDIHWNNKECIFILFGASVLLEVLLFYQYVLPHNGKYFFDQDPIGADFIVFWSAAILAITDRLPEIFDYQKFHEAQTVFLGYEYQLRLWHYPPYFLFFLTPLAWFAYIPAYCVWNICTFLLYAATMVFRQSRGLALLALVVAPATFVNILCGQNGFISAALFVGGMLLRRDYPIVSGLLFGLLSYKPHLGILIPVVIIAERNWKVFFSAAVTFLSIFTASVLVHGIDIWKTYATETMGNTTIVLEKVGGFLTYIMPTVFMSGRILGLGEMDNYSLQWAVMLVVMGGTYWAVRHSSDINLQTAVACVGVFLVSPWAYNYDMTIVSAALVLIAEIGQREGFLPGEGLILVLIWFLPIGVILLNAAGFPIAPIIVALLFFLLLVRVHLSSKEKYALSMV